MRDNQSVVPASDIVPGAHGNSARKISEIIKQGYLRPLRRGKEYETKNVNTVTFLWHRFYYLASAVIKGRSKRRLSGTNYSFIRRRFQLYILLADDRHAKHVKPVVSR